MPDLLLSKQRKHLPAQDELSGNNLEIRLAKKSDILSQKEIWKLCFGDKDKFIDFYFENRYQEDQTLLLLKNGKPAAMLTMLPVKIVIPDLRTLDTVMIYAMATHPAVQNQGLAGELLEFCDRYLQAGNITFSILVPQQRSLFDFYRRYGYQEGFYIRESLWTREAIDQFPVPTEPQGTISAAGPEEYNTRRNRFLAGRLYIAYGIDDIIYQKKLSQWSGADIYLLEAGDYQGCAVIEKITPERFIIKEMLMADPLIPLFLKQIAQNLTAKEFIVRTPAYLGQSLGGTLRPFGMLKEPKNIRRWGTDCNGYMGLAFD